ncbi:MAG: fibrobacter succinogenes major paralogous domain-containing protein [Fibromonadaceae bacterium]|nr:fibrobacter succinogenes major paralogous domain-containing protein [Fibromonadaceae bacterium]
MAKCGVNPQTYYNPDLYTCKPSINPNGIFLINPVSYGGESYEAVLIGTQTWMARNLNFNATGSVCYENEPENCDKYGRLYDWDMAMDNASSSNATPSGVQGVRPDGWHLPSDAEWSVLMTAVGGYFTAGTKLKAASGWSSGNGTDDYGFSALPGGSRSTDGSFSVGTGGGGYWWTATERESGSNAFFQCMGSGYEYVIDGSGNKAFGFSVRCLQDVR